MAEPAPPHSALDRRLASGTFAVVPDGGPQVRLTERRGLGLVHLAMDAADQMLSARLGEVAGVALPETANTGHTQDRRTALWTGPGTWLLVALDGDAAAALEAALRGVEGARSVAAVDLSQGRTVVRMEGPAAARVLAKGCAIDLHPRRLLAGDCAQTNLGAIPVLIHAVDDGPCFDLFVARSYAVSAWQWLTDAAAEFGYQVRPGP